MAVAAGIIANGVTEILKKLSSVVANEITLVWDFNDELKNLQSTLSMIMDVMEDAEKKQVSDAAVGRWMEELKGIAYDAEDILDEYSYEVILRKRGKEKECKSRIHNKVRKVFSGFKPSVKVIRKLAQQINEINERFKIIAKRRKYLGLQNGSSSSSHELMMKNRETNSFVPEDWKILGRENDKSNIIKMLLEEEEDSSNNQGDGGKHISVIPIVGMGGLGKTTMAQQVYNDESVQKHFQLKIWICVSDPFDIKKLYKNIANSIGKVKEYDDATTMNDISHLLQETFRGNKFILVLDDVWNENPAYWNNFKKPFMVGREGSKILVTTRSVKVAELMEDKFQPYPLGILSDTDSWSLFKEIAFGFNAGETTKLMEIGKTMVKRCGGLPLAVVFLGSLMRSKKKEEEWKIIRDTKLWHESREGKNSEILPSLRLSYDYLPSHLKLCFSYCCLFPKDWIIKRETLIRLWMAEGFLIELPGENAILSMEEIGNEYFHSLLSGFFFQDVLKNGDGDVYSCKMHDLVHDLARSVVGNHECLIVENASAIDYISEETRRLSLSVNLDDEEILLKVLAALKKAKKLRTVFVNDQRICFDIDIGNAFKENKRLRVLDLNKFHVTIKWTSSIGGLKHLRYFATKGVYFPEGMMIGRLSFLQTLSYFTVGDKKKKCGIGELENLKLLGGHLTIDGLKNVTKACRANLKEKNLRGLHLSWDFGGVDSFINHEEEEEEAVLEGLRPHPNLRTLKINCFPGARLPRWIQEDSSSSCLPNLVKLTLLHCEYIEQVAGFGALPSLRSLTLWRMKKLKCIGNEFYYSAIAGGGGGGSRSSTAGTGEASTAAATTIAFPSLKKLVLRLMESLKEWVVPLSTTTTGAGATTNNYCFPLLEEIIMEHCPRLSTITPTTTIFPSLKVLYLVDIDGRAAETLVTNNLNSLTSVTLYNISSLTTLPRRGLMENNNILLSLVIGECDKFEGFFPPPPNNNEEEEGHEGGCKISSSSCSSSSSLQTLKLHYCPALRFYPNILSSLTSLRTLEIEECKISKSLKDELTCLSSSLENLEHVRF